MRMLKYFHIAIIFLMIYIPLISCNFITMKFKGTGNENIFINNKNGIDCPNRIYIDEKLISKKTCKYKFPIKIVSIKMEWDKIFIHCYKMFADISNIIEIDLSQFNTSLVKNMSYMFDNCKSLKFVNLSNIDISSLINMDNAFRNCKSLKSIDLTNFDLSKIPYHKNIFHNCINLNNKVKDKSYEGKTNIKILNEQNKLIYNDKKRALIDYEKCNINNIFNQDRLCTIKALSKEEIIEQLRENDNRVNVNLINNILNNNDKISIINHNEIYSILKLDFGDDIRIKECETILKNKYNISKNSSIFIFLQEIQQDGFTSEIIGEFFDSNKYLNKSFCEKNITEYINEIDSPNNFYCNYAHHNLRQRLLNSKFNYNIKNKDISSY